MKKFKIIYRDSFETIIEAKTSEEASEKLRLNKCKWKPLEEINLPGFLLKEFKNEKQK